MSALPGDVRSRGRLPVDSAALLDALHSADAGATYSPLGSTPWLYLDLDALASLPAQQRRRLQPWVRRRACPVIGAGDAAGNPLGRGLRSRGRRRRRSADAHRQHRARAACRHDPGAGAAGDRAAADHAGSPGRVDGIRNAAGGSGIPRLARDARARAIGRIRRTAAADRACGLDAHDHSCQTGSTQRALGRDARCARRGARSRRIRSDDRDRGDRRRRTGFLRRGRSRGIRHRAGSGHRARGAEHAGCRPRRSSPVAIASISGCRAPASARVRSLRLLVGR